ncbi:esterase-like activity of phytase family protein, partial [Rubrivirga sp.]|uniref:esterase-like activity of phytase family protein n=1 Tax=Rubrivirga sp. TaxID=1885344 RepID=UPI003C7947C9
RRRIATPGGAATGRPIPATTDATVETAIGPDGEVLEPDPWGIDAEGIAFDGASVWVSEEYRPSLWRLDAATGDLLERWTPDSVHAIDRALPPVIEGRQPNLGFEGVAVVEGAVWASLQGPITTPTSSPLTPFVRLLRLDPGTGRTSTFAYPMDGPARKVGDLARHQNRLLVLEHGPVTDRTWSGQVYVLEIASATPLGPEDAPEDADGVLEAEAAGVPVLGKTLVLDLVPAGWPAHLHKPEGLAVLEDGRLAILADNDYGVDAPAGDGRPMATGDRTTLVVFAVDL